MRWLCAINGQWVCMQLFLFGPLTEFQRSELIRAQYVLAPVGGATTQCDSGEHIRHTIEEQATNTWGRGQGFFTSKQRCKTENKTMEEKCRTLYYYKAVN